MRTANGALFVTGATGLVGGQVLERMLEADPELHAFVLVRDVTRWQAHALRRRIPPWRVTAVEGDLTQEGLGLDELVRRSLERRITTVLHCAADTVFSRPLAEARQVNAQGTARVLEFAEGARGVGRFVHVSTAFVAGRHVGRILERDNGAGPGFVNSYEESKFEAEQLVRAAPTPWVILRPSVIVCNGRDGGVSQFNAVHRALRLYHAGLASMMPGEEDNRVDCVTADHVATCVAALTQAEDIEGQTFHICAGDGAIRLGELLDESYAVWSESLRWRRKAIPRPALTDLETYRLFERTAEQTGDERLRNITRSLSHFVSQLALPKHFDTSGTERVTGRPAPPVIEFWSRLVRHLLHSRWAASARRAA